MKIGEIITGKSPVIINQGKKTKTISVTNLGDRPVQVGSHYHFFFFFRCLDFDRKEAFGFHLDIPSGTSVRFEPGEEKEVRLTEMGGKKRVYGLNDLARCQTIPENLNKALEKAWEEGFAAMPGQEAGERSRS